MSGMHTSKVIRKLSGFMAFLEELKIDQKNKHGDIFCGAEIDGAKKNIDVLQKLISFKTKKVRAVKPKRVRARDKWTTENELEFISNMKESSLEGYIQANSNRVCENVDYKQCVAAALTRLTTVRSKS